MNNEIAQELLNAAMDYMDLHDKVRIESEEGMRLQRAILRAHASNAEDGTA